MESHLNSKADERIEVLKSMLEEQLELLRLSLYLATQGPIEYAGQVVSCSIVEAKQKTSCMVAMAAGQSVNTVLRLSSWRGIPVRDLYPVARSALESFINAAYLLAEDATVAERAIRHVAFASYRQQNRNIGAGRFSMQLSSGAKASSADTLKFQEFKGRNTNWTSLDAVSRLTRVGELAGNKAGSRFLGAYGVLYAISSEIIHGSPFGVNYFYQAHLPEGAGVNEFREATGEQVADVLSALLHGQAGYLATFFAVLDLKSMAAAEQALFDKYLSTEGIAPQ